MDNESAGNEQQDMVLMAFASTFSALILFVIGVKLIKYISGDSNPSIVYSSKTHSWKSTAILDRAYFCNVCELLIPISAGLFCDACGLFTHPKCSKAANQQFKCKVISQTNEAIKHHWVRGNLHPDSVCDVCEEDCEGGFSLDKRCSWCQRTVHASCSPNLADVCDFGPFRPLIVPPMSIQVIHHKNRLRRRLVVKTITPPSWTDWTPLIVVANAKSGGSEAEDVAALFRGYLNPAQVVSLGSIKPDTALEWCRLVKDVHFRVLVAGGDGTVAWVLNTIHSMKLPNPPSVAILPFGTGNDLSRILGWGGGLQTADVDVSKTLYSLLSAQPVNLDRWCVRILPTRSLPLKSGMKELYMYNYAGFGVDAQVSLGFHNTRQSPLYLFNSRLFNKILYVCFGTGEIIEKTYQNLQEGLDIYLDGHKVELPSIEGIVVINIDSFGAGMHLWAMGNEEHPNGPTCSINDKKLEVVAFYSSFHMGGLQMNVGTPYRVGQAKTVKVVLHREIAVQIDGEPWKQQPAEVVFKAVNHAVMLQASN